VPLIASRALISTAELGECLGRPEFRIVDVRWYLDPARRGRDAYFAGHVPGAVFLDVDRDLSAPGGVRGGALGRHPWPSEAQVAHVLGAAGIRPTDRVVAYDDQSGAVAARLWYLLRAHGHEAVSVLDGGFAKWIAEGRPVETAEPKPEPASYEARLAPGLVLGKADVIALGRDALVLDARAPERYRGEVEPIDPRAGHIPGAKSAPFTFNLTSEPVPVFRPPAELRARYEALGAGAVGCLPVVYCGSGVTACHDLLALHLAGLRGRLYAGSWSEWSSDEALPVATGSE
jgi:thiosulfate/3-mercaptopyruvate sulfurtransferase